MAIEGPRNNENGVNLRSELLRADLFPSKKADTQNDSLDTNKRLSESFKDCEKPLENIGKLGFSVVDKKGQKVDCSFDLTQQGCILVIGSNKFPIIDQGYNIKEVGFDGGNLFVKGDKIALNATKKSFLGLIDKLLDSKQ